MKKKQKKRNFLLSLLVVIIVIQVSQTTKINPPFDIKNDFIELTNPSENVKKMFINSCYNCHSNQTKYPWYSYIAPASWVIKKHVDGAREHINFSNWGNYSTEVQQTILQECMEEIKEGEMPLKLYVKAHDDAKLSEKQIEELIKWIKSDTILEI